MPTTHQLLAAHGITLQQAHDWVMARVSHPSDILHVARQFGITNTQLGEIAGGFSGAQVRAFFGGHGLDSATLDASLSMEVASASLLPLAALVAPDTHTGALATSALHTRVVAKTGDAAYAAAFPNANFESEFYGTLINALKAIDLGEAAKLASFAQSHQAAFAANPLSVASDGADLLVSVLTTPARVPLLSDSVVADAAVAAGTYFVELVGHPGASAAMLQGLFGAFNH